MATYTATADSNGDFTVPFSSNYTAGQKVTVTAAKDGATKSIELYAPSEATGGGNIRFSGNSSNFPINIGNITIAGLSGLINNYAFAASANNYNMFYVATGLTIEDGVTDVGAYAFHGWASSKFVNIPSSVKTIGQNAFYVWSAATDLTIPNSVTSIGSNSFYGWTSATSLTISSSLTNIPSNAFYGWNRMASLIIPNSVITIADNAFNGWVAATSLTLPNILTSVGANAFANWKQLQILNIPASVTNIAAGAFAGLLALTKIKMNSSAPPTITPTTFSQLPAGCIIEVPSSALATYQAATNWSTYASKMIGV
jgi:hypothetical protein